MIKNRRKLAARISAAAMLLCLLLGLCGAVVAFGLQWLLYEAVANGIGSSDTMQLLEVTPFISIWKPVAMSFAAAGVVIGVGGSLMAIRRFLKV